MARRWTRISLVAGLLGASSPGWAAVPLNPGDLTISEFMAEPQEVPNYTGEWFEIHNPTAEAMDVQGLVVRGGESDIGFTVLDDLTIEPGGYMVLGVGDCDDYVNCGTNEYNGGVQVGYLYDRLLFVINENGDTIELIYGGQSLDTVTWTAADWSITKDYAHQANINSFDLEWANDLSHNWCPADTLYGEESLYGTPGAANTPCDDALPQDDDGDGYTEIDGDCDDTDPYINPPAVDGDGADPKYGNADDDADCDGVRDDGGIDDDGDGFTELVGDCDDENVAVNPEESEVEDDFDNDCDGCADNLDADSDGYPGLGDDKCEVADFDCDDADTLVNPGISADVPYDGKDNECAGGDLCDVDGDGYLADPADVCPGLDCCDPATHPSQDPGGDCDDNNPDVNPAGSEGDPANGGAPDGADNDCDGVADNPYLDRDGDGFSEVDGDCLDNPENEDSPLVFPGAEETCGDLLDNDCDGLFNDGCEDRGRYAAIQGGSLCGAAGGGAGAGFLGLLLAAGAVLRRTRGGL